MILNLTNITDEEIKERAEIFLNELENGTLPVVRDCSDDYSDKLWQSFNNMTKEKEKFPETNSSDVTFISKNEKPFQKSKRK